MQKQNPNTMVSTKVSATALKLAKEQALREGRFLWRIFDDALFDYLKRAARQKGKQS